MPQNKDKKNIDEINLSHASSSISSFIKRPVPTEDEVEEFEEAVEEELKEEDIEESLSEIYQDDDGNMVDVKEFSIKKKRGFWFYFLNLIVLLLFLGGLAYGLYSFYLSSASSSNTVRFFVEAEDSVVAGEEFYYSVIYNNTSRFGLNNIQIQLDFNDDFIFLDSSPQASMRKSIWLIDYLPAHSSGKIDIKGKIVAPENSEHITSGKIIYTPDNFSSEFKKEASHNIKVSDIGFDVSVDSPDHAFVGTDSEIIIDFYPQQENFLGNFLLAMEKAENISFSVEAVNKEGEPEKISITEAKPGFWQLVFSAASGADSDINASSTSLEDGQVKIKYRVNEKISEKQDITIKLFQENEGKEYVFYKRTISTEIIKSDFNLNLKINDSENLSSVNFSEELRYKISYTNKGESAMRDMAIIVILESDLLDWTTLNDPNSGSEKGNFIIWTKEEVPALAEVKSGATGEINFSIKTLPFRESDIGKLFSIKSYAQYNIGSGEVKEGEDNSSNTVITNFNSDLSLSEEVRYFNSDNIPVGSGPLPLRVGETTTFKVYWKITNNLHELNNTKVEVKLPDYVEWDDKARTSVGTVSYDQDSHQVSWQIGRLPISVYRADAEFSISVMPGAEDQGRIMVIIPGSTASAVDNETQAGISRATSAKTTKMEDDEIARVGNDGRVE